MYVVRRHSRRLFFPAGLLALAWLLCLGCGVLAGRPELRQFRQRVMQVSVPPYIQLGSKAHTTWRYPQEWYASPAQLDTLVPWHTVQLTGSVWQDYFNMRTAEFVASQLSQEPNHTRGLQIKFGPKSSYASFVRILDIVYQAKLKKYWLATQHDPLTFYSFTHEHPPVEPVEVLDGCYLCNDDIPYIPPPPTWQQQLRAELRAAFQAATWRPLFSPDWRYSTLLLLLLPLAAAWQLRRLRTFTR